MIGYMDKVDFECHMEHDCMPVSVYAEVDELRADRPCVESCGIIKVEVTMVEVIQEESYE